MICYSICKVASLLKYNISDVSVCVLNYVTINIVCIKRNEFIHSVNAVKLGILLNVATLFYQSITGNVGVTENSRCFLEKFSPLWKTGYASTKWQTSNVICQHNRSLQTILLRRTALTIQPRYLDRQPSQNNMNVK